MKSNKKRKKDTKLLSKSLSPNLEYDLGTEDKYVTQIQGYAEKYYKYVGADPYNAGDTFLDPRIENDFKIQRSLLKLDHIDHTQYYREKEIRLAAAKRIKDGYCKMLRDEIDSV